jgi:hypothetical protein
MKDAARRVGNSHALGAIFFLVAFLLSSCLVASDLSAQTLSTTASANSNLLAGKPLYRVVSQTPDEVVIDVSPDYEYANLADSKTGQALKSVTASGASMVSLSGARPKEGSPAIPVMTLLLLAPNDEPVEVSLSQTRQQSLSGVLAPVPHYIHAHGALEPSYEVKQDLYRSSWKISPTVLTGSRFRTAKTQRVMLPLVAFDGGSAIALLQHATLTIHFHHVSVLSAPSHISAQEREMLEQTFVNGDVPEYYESARAELLQSTSQSASKPLLSTTQSISGGQWLQVTTTQEGVYHITAQDLANAGISGSIDTAAIQLFGVGGGMLSEVVNPLTGELRECAIEVHAGSNGSFGDLEFYAPGIVTWTYRPGSGAGKIDNLFHVLNTYNTSGYYLLKVGGSAGGALRVHSHPDTVSNATVSNTVFAALLTHSEKSFEHPNESRQFVGSLIPFDGSQLSIQMQSPGYSSAACAYLRVGFDSYAFNPHSVNVSVNGTMLGSLTGDPVQLNTDNQDISRSWDQGVSICSPLVPPFTTNLTLTTTEQNPQVWLAWLELFYQRTTDLSAGSVPFMVLDTSGSFSYRFSNAKQGEVWEVTDDSRADQVGVDDGSGSISLALNGVAGALRKFIAFAPATLLSPQLSATPAPLLRTTIGQMGAQDIIIAPQEFLVEADSLMALRNAGGEATDPLKTVVVTVEDINREFGYGGKDLTGIRDFLSYTFRHTTANGASVPLFVTLFGAGHADYQNRVSQTANRVPAYEEPDYFDRRTSIGPQDIHCDDGFFARLTNNSTPDVGLGRLSAESDADAATVVDKLQHYERGSEDGLWRGVASFVADDRFVEHGQIDGLRSSHIGDTQSEIANMLSFQQRVRVNRVFEVNYPYIIGSTGYFRPAAAQAILNAFNQGSVLLSFIGHGNPDVWTHESVLVVPSTINAMTNYDRLAFVTTATCDFSVCDDFSVLSGGVQLILNPNGGGISLLGTTRQVYPGDPLVQNFYRTLFNVPCNSKYSTAHIGTCIMVGYQLGDPAQLGPDFYLQGDPALRLLLPKQYVSIDTINSQKIVPGVSILKLPALSTVTIAAHVSNNCDGSTLDQSFNGSATLTLFDADVPISRTSTFTNSAEIDVDNFNVEGPILYRGAVSVINGEIHATFVIPKDVEIDTNRARINILAYASDRRAALGIDTSLQLLPTDSATAVRDISGPYLAAWIGSRLFRPGDTVATNSVLIVDVKDGDGLNTSTAGVGHSFAAWVDDSTANMIDLSGGYVAKQNDFTSGTSTTNVSLPVGPHVLHVRAFDASDNPMVVSLPFVGRGAYGLYQVSTFPSPMTNETTISFTQTGGEGVPVDITISLYTVDGRKLRDLQLPGVTSTSIQAQWDGRDAGGNSVASGAYFYSVTAKNLTTGAQAHISSRLIVLK